MSDLLLSIIDALIDGFGGALTWLLVGIITFFLDLYRRFKQLRDDVDDLDRYLTGDDSDPDAPGLLRKVEHIDSELGEMKDEMRDQHRTTDRKLDRLIEDRGDS